jgi:sulfatase modifying factor 1
MRAFLGRAGVPVILWAVVGTLISGCDTKSLRNATSGELVLVRGGILRSGSELAGEAVEDFWIGKYEVTRGEWRTVEDWADMRGYDGLYAGLPSDQDDHPVRSISWYAAIKWCNARSEKEGKTPVYRIGGAVYRTGEGKELNGVKGDLTLETSGNGYRLPLEKEWEWAARGGGASKGYTYSGSDVLDDVGWYWGNSRTWVERLGDQRYAQCVGKKRANELGLHDMSGNVSELCFRADGIFVERGGNFLSGAFTTTIVKDCTTVYRDSGSNVDGRGSYIGFRVASSSVP